MIDFKLKDVVSCETPRLGNRNCPVTTLVKKKFIGTKAISAEMKIPKGSMEVLMSLGLIKDTTTDEQINKDLTNLRLIILKN